MECLPTYNNKRYNSVEELIAQNPDLQQAIKFFYQSTLNTQAEARVFDDSDKFDITEEVVSRALKSVDITKDVNAQILFRSVVSEYDKMISELREQGKDREADFMQDKREEILGITQNEDGSFSEGLYEDTAREYINTLFDVESLDEILDSTGENVKEVGQSSYEIDITESLSLKTKILLSGIKDTRIPAGFANWTGIMTLPDALDALHQIMSEANSNSLEDIKKIVEAKIAKNPKELGFYQQIYDRLKEAEIANPEVINEIMYNLYQPKVQMKFVMWQPKGNGYMSAKVYDANVKNPLFIKRAQWNENLKMSGLIDMYDGNKYRINEKAYERVTELFDKVHNAYNEDKNINAVNRQDLIDLLEYFGIELNNKTIDNIYSEENTDDLELAVALLSGKESILSVIKNNIDTAKNHSDEGKKLTLNSTVTNKDKLDTIELNLLTRRNSRINDLIHSDNFVEFMPMGTMYLAGKTINMYQQPNAITNKIKNLKRALQAYQDALEKEDNPEYTGLLKEFADTPITSNSLLLGLLKNNPKEAVKYLDTFLISLEALKKGGEKSRDDMGITELSDKDAMVSLLGMFSSSEGSFSDVAFDTKYSSNLKLRKGLINFPTVSDSSQLPFLKTILLDITKDNVDTTEELIGDDVMDVLKEQMLMSDLLRIADYLTKVGEKGSNIDGYDAGAIWITGMPSLNGLQIPFSYTDNEGKSIETTRPLVKMFRDFISSNPENNTREKIEDFLQPHMELIEKEINESVAHEVSKLVSSDLKSGQFVEFEMLNGDKLTMSNGSEESDYFSKRTAREVAYDYVINSMLQQKEIQTLFAGDLAQYFKNKMSDDLQHGMPRVDFKDIVNYYYSNPEQVARINEILDGKKPKELSQEKIETLLAEFPEFKNYELFLTLDINPEDAYKALLPIVSRKVNDMFKGVQNNLSKRLKGQISPGSQFANTANLPNYIQIMVNDVENASETLIDLVSRYYPQKETELADTIREFKELDNIYHKTPEQKDRHSDLMNILKKEIPEISAYLKTTSTDAQEYTSWKENLLQLKSQGRITKSQHDQLYNKLEAQVKDLEQGDTIKPENMLTAEERTMAVMQPSKPLYSGMVHNKVGEGQNHGVQRYVYIKSSSFPLLPEMTQMFPKLNSLRKNMDKIEAQNEGTTVRVSYQSANKVGAVKNAVSVAELYKDEPDFDKISASSLFLPRENFYIQQDKPFKSDKNLKNNKIDKVTRATQFEKIILGDGINKMGAVFPMDMFDADMLSSLGVEAVDGMLTGPQLKQIYNGLYEKEQKILSDKLFNELGIKAYSDISEGKPEVMEELARLLNKRITNKQDKKALELLYQVKVDGIPKTLTKNELIESGLKADKAIFKIPLFMTPNSRKFESVLNSVINKNNINLKLPGFSFPVASQEGFDYKHFTPEAYENLLEKGLIVTPNFDPAKGLQSTRDSKTGELKYAQVFLANKYKVFNTETKKYEYLDLKEYVKDGKIDLEKLPTDLLSMFSFRIPTSAHQSGTIIEVAGFLPHNMGDLMIVPKDHTVQIGEDYDIDVRYAYQYNYIKDENGNIKKIEYKDIEKPEFTMKELKEMYDTDLDNLWNEFYEEKGNVDTNAPLNTRFTHLKNPYFKHNKQAFTEIAFLEEALENHSLNKLMSALFGEYFDEDTSLSRDAIKERLEELKASLFPRDMVKEKADALKEEYKTLKANLKAELADEKSALKSSWLKYNNARNQKADELKVIENNLIAMYKTVFASPSTEVQNMVTKVLSTDFSEQSAEEIDSKLSQKEPYFNIYSPSVQRKVMKLGADGKMGIGVHSNAVTMNSILQQLDNKIQFISHQYTDPKTGEITNIPYKIKLGKNTFDGVLGKVESSGRKISEYLMESQNSATDNQKLEIMGRRNENAETISVFSLLQMTGMEEDGLLINGKEVSYASLFIAQPAIIEYVKIIKGLKSSTDNTFGNTEELAENKIFEKLIGSIPTNMFEIDEKTKEPKLGIFTREAKETLGKLVDSKYLFDQIGPLDKTNTNLNAAAQLYLFQSFVALKKPAKELGELQSFVNIENGGLGISYFDVINLKNKIGNIQNLKMATTDKIGRELKADESSVNLFSEMFGNISYVREEQEDAKEAEEKLISEGYIFVSKSKGGTSVYIKPSNHYSHKIINSIGLGYNMWNSVFPYDQKNIQQQTDTILSIMGINPDTKKGLEMKYSIISSMKDYAYTSSRGLFNGDVGLTQRELFFDDKENNQESLGTYLLRLKKDPAHKQIFNLPFFKDLQIVKGEKSHPTIIKYNTGDMTPLNNMKMYNRLSKLVNSQRVLPTKLNGKEMTEAELMKDILKYAMLADQGNGAIGFRHLLPLSLFEKYKVDAVLRNRNDLNTNVLNFVYNGPIAAAQSTLGSAINDRGIIMNNAGNSMTLDEIKAFTRLLNTYTETETGMKKAFGVDSEGNIHYKEYRGEENPGNFIRQYIQHNYEKLKSLNYNEKADSPMHDFFKESGIQYEDFNKGYVTELTSTSKNVPFFTIKDKDGNILLFERISSDSPVGTDNEVHTYKRIPTLGVFGFNEYKTNGPVNRSLVKDNNFKDLWFGKSIVYDRHKNFINENHISDIIKSMSEDTRSPYKALIEMLTPFIGDLNNVEIKTVSNLQGAASYKVENGVPTISINEQYLKMEGVTNRDVQAKIMEEVLHHVTKTVFGDYVEFTGFDGKGLTYNQLQDTIPSEIKSLITVYNYAFKQQMNKYGKEAFMEKIKNFGQAKDSNNAIISESELDEAAYRASNFHEFIAGIFLKDSSFAKDMAQTPYMESGKSVIAKFSELLLRLFNKVLPGARKDSISANVLEQLHNLLVEYDSNPSNKFKPHMEKVLVETPAVLEAKDILETYEEVAEDIDDLTFTEEYRGLKVLDTEDITNAEGQRGAAQYDRKNNIIKVNRPLLQEKFAERAWTKMRELTEAIHGEKIKSKAKNLPENQFKTYEQFEKFVIEHEYQHSIYSRADFDKNYPGKTKGDYETEINDRAIMYLENTKVLADNIVGINDLFSPLSKNNVSLLNPITNVKTKCK